MKTSTETGSYQRGLDLTRLINPKTRGGKIIAQCPVCAAAGGDKSAEHLVIFDNGAGKWGCVQHAGNKDHRRLIAAAIGREKSASPFPLLRSSPRPQLTPEPRKLKLPPLRVPAVGELAQLAELRQLPFIAGLELAVRAGSLRCAEMFDAGVKVKAWVLTDSGFRCAQARRLDGKPWHGIGDVKAKTLPGSQAAWPIGAADIGAKPYVALCEGGPDTLAAWSIAWWEGKANAIAPVCMAGAGIRIASDALTHFTGKGVYIFPHRDEAGERARANWIAQLAAADVLWVKPFDVNPHKDLNEWLTAVRAEIGRET